MHPRCQFHNPCDILSGRNVHEDFARELRRRELRTLDVHERRNRGDLDGLGDTSQLHPEVHSERLLGAQANVVLSCRREAVHRCHDRVSPPPDRRESVRAACIRHRSVLGAPVLSEYGYRRAGQHPALLVGDDTVNLTGVTGLGPRERCAEQ